MSDGTAMHRAMRLADLMWRFDKGQRFTAREICKRYGVSRRTIQRDIRDINEFVMPIDFETCYPSSEQPERRYGFWRLDE